MDDCYVDDMKIPFGEKHCFHHMLFDTPKVCQRNWTVTNGFIAIIKCSYNVNDNDSNNDNDNDDNEDL